MKKLLSNSLAIIIVTVLITAIQQYLELTSYVFLFLIIGMWFIPTITFLSNWFDEFFGTSNE